ncbi:Gfo/Idh/MocA family oxidoreductase [Psychrosphaera sp. F3M07]|uniref:Gfo/Idh/MocA family protein n=1 Tax=Psychrosphaera sp. F3M07 TaxID=2841560 RepID=UPI001C09647B|nr:Gfo/Idh/MocA family oxidoreductase [Psychrosphaera sp. F3M07]MBU2917736.1 Gfo/Idh/MocA family oxidoreductase [Psychrosphaera sp. F3M07]
MRKLAVHNYKKLFRFYLIYGFKRTVVKALGRLRINVNIVLLLFPLKYFYSKKDIAVIGCGQFTFATIGFFISKNFGRRIKYCFDIDQKNLDSFAKCYGVQHRVIIKTGEQLPKLKGISLAYIASNHYSHTDYALNLLEQGIDVYIEKPVSVNREQLAKIEQAYILNENRIYVGYNRPHSKAINELKKYLVDTPFTLTCTIAGHVIDSEHWYRDIKEGTRVCGNLGHWIDLAIDLLYATKSTIDLTVDIIWSDDENKDDNLCLVLKSARGDLISIVLTARNEPFEGINEMIFFQQDGVLAKIDDFREAEFQIGTKKIKRKYYPKDVGHETAILQPFHHIKRDFNCILVSSRLMLQVMEQIQIKSKTNKFIDKI